MLARIVLLLTVAVIGLPTTANAEGNGLAVLLTDYGNDSIYVGILKGAMYSKAPDITIDTVTNSVPPFDIRTGAYILAEACGAYPTGTVFSCVVDPGVGTERKCIAIKTKTGQYFVAPDNGLLTLVARRDGIAELRECTNEDLWYSKGSSATFHGRDIFGPVAAAIANGTPLKDVGPKMKSLIQIDLRESEVRGGAAHGEVMRSDPYGNLVTTLTSKDFTMLGIKLGDTLQVSIGGQGYEAPFAKTYGAVERGSRLVLLQSSQFVECAINQASLRDVTGAEPGTPIVIRKAP